MTRHRHLRGAEALEDHGWRRAREPGEPLRQRGRRSPFDHHVGIWMRPAEALVAHVAADDPGGGALVRRGLLQQAQDVLVGCYWLIRAHSTAPT